MKKPSKKLTEKAKLAKQTPKIEEAVAWARLLMSIPVVEYGFTIIEEVYSTWKGKEIMEWDGCSDNGSLFSFHIVFPLSYDKTVGRYTMLASSYFPGDKAQIENDVFEGEMPPFLIGNPILGFSGTWEEVTLKIIELNDLLNSQIPDVPLTLKE